MAQAIETSKARSSRLRLRRFLRDIHIHAHNAHRHREDGLRVRNELQHLESLHPDWMGQNTRRTSGYLLLTIVILAVLVLDIMLFSPTAEYLALTAFSGHQWLTWIARLLVPVAIISIEIALGIQISFAREDAEETENFSPYWGWLAIGLLFAVVMPSLVVSTTLASKANSPENMSWIYNFQLVGLAVLAFISHIVIILGGRYAHEAKGYLFFKIKQRSLATRIERIGTTLEGMRRLASDSFLAYYNSLDHHNAYHSSTPVRPGPFDEITRQLINEMHGREIVETDNRGQSNHRIPVSEDSTRQAEITSGEGGIDSGDAEMAGNSSLRDDESEVKI